MVVPWWDGGGWCCRRTLGPPPTFFLSLRATLLLTACGVYPSVMRRELWKSGLVVEGDRELAVGVIVEEPGLGWMQPAGRAWEGSCQNAVVEGGSDAGSDNIEARVEGRCL